MVDYGNKQLCYTAEPTTTHAHTSIHCRRTQQRDWRERDWMRKRGMLGNKRRPEWKGKIANCHKWIAVECYWQPNDILLTRVAILMCVCVCPCGPASLLDRINSRTFSQHPWAPVLWAPPQRSVFHHKHHKRSLITAGSEDKLLKYTTALHTRAAPGR